MAEFACLVGGALRDIRDLPARPPHIPHKGVRWHPVVRQTDAPASQGVVGDDYVIVTRPPGPPRAVSVRQLRIALLRAGRLAAAQTAASGANGEIRIAWDHAETIRRDGPLIARLATQLNLSDADVDALFTVAGGV